MRHAPGSPSAEIVVELLRAFADVRESLNARAAQFRTLKGVSSVVSAMDVRNYTSGLTLEFFIDVRLESNRTVCWWLECRLVDTDWAVEASLLGDAGEGQFVLNEIQAERASESAELPTTLRRSTASLLELAPPTDFTKLELR